jgi:methylated-DNA-[protein]-cysteine S-methyltransferase
MESPVGTLTLVAGDRGLVAILWQNENLERAGLGALKKVTGHPLLVEAERQLQEYFAGKRTQFSLDLDWRGTEFQKRVWVALLEIPFGETRSYADIARQLGNPKAVRAVGAANGKNPIPIIAPCHRVIGSNGKLVGFGGGLATKALLLKLESRASSASPSSCSQPAHNPMVI